MLSFALVIALAAAAPSANTLLQPRADYSACLKKFQRSSLREKMDPAAFATAVKTACPDEAAALKNALINYDVATGVKRSTAEANADLDLAGYTDNFGESYKDYFETNTMPN